MTKNKFKKVLAIGIALLLLTALMTTLIFSASPYQKLLLLGDSITTGYGLEGEKESPESYAEQLRDYLRIPKQNSLNAAVNGATSADLLALLPALETEVFEADIIVVTIGGNDLLNLVWTAADKVLDGGYQSPEQLIEIFNDPVLKDRMMAELSLFAILDAMNVYTLNLRQIVSDLRAKNQEAEIIFLAQYNPFSGIEEYQSIAPTIEGAISMLNTSMQTEAVTGGCTYLDVYTPFQGHSADWTNIAEFDIHPNSEGHRQIFGLIKEYLGDIPFDTESSLPEENDSTATEEMPESDPTVTEDSPESSPVELPITEDIPESAPTVTEEPLESDPGESDVTENCEPTTPDEEEELKASRGCGSNLAATEAIFSLLLVLGVLFCKKSKEK